MKPTLSFIVAAATLNLAIGAPIAEQRSRAVVAKDAVKRAAANNPYLAREANAAPSPGSATPGTMRSVLKFLGRRGSFGRLNARYTYHDTPRPALSVEHLDKRYTYQDTPRPAKSVENRHRWYDHDPPQSARSVEGLDRWYEHNPPRSAKTVEGLDK